MVVSPEFQKALNEEDILMIRIMLKDSLVVDPTFAEFNQMIVAAEKTLINLYDEHDGEELSYDISKWTKDYMDEQMVKVVNNFSKERLNFLKNICKQLFRDKVQKIGEKRRIQAYKSSEISKKQVGVGLAIGGATTAIVGIAVAKPVIIVAGVAVAAVGGFMIATDN